MYDITRRVRCMARKPGKVMSRIRYIWLLCLAVLTPVAHAVGDAVAGKEKAVVCVGCHGEDGNSLYPGFPKLAGQLENYIFKQTMDFKTGKRKDEVMSGIISIIPTEADLRDIAAWYASQPVMQGEDADADLVSKGERLYLDKKCVLCHGPNGRSESGMSAPPPIVGGQHAPYLVKALNDIGQGVRSGDIYGLMTKSLAPLSDQEIEALAAYMSSR